MKEKEAKLDYMLTDISNKYQETIKRLEILKSEDKTKTATYRQLLGNKMQYQLLIDTFKKYGLME